MTIYFVAAAGSDSNNGTSAGTPWQTISKVNSSVFVAGDFIGFNCGDSWREALTPPSPGSNGSPITFGAYGNGVSPIINGSDLVAGWTASASWGVATSNAGNADLGGGTSAWRNAIEAAAIAVGGTKIRITMKAQTGHSLVIAGMSIGQASTAASSTFTATPTRVTWGGGNNGVTITSGASVVSDEIAFTLDNSKRHIVAVDYTDGFARYQSGAGANFHTWFGASGHVLDLVFPGSGDGGPDCQVIELEAFSALTNVWQAALTTQPPNSTYFNGAVGTQVASAVLCNAAGKWFWSTNVLYVYSTTDPTTAYVAPGIEAEIRANAIVNTKDYITVDGLGFTHVYQAAISTIGANTTRIQNCEFANINLGSMLAAGYGCGYFRNCQNGYFGHNTILNVNIDGVAIYNNAGGAASDGFVIEDNTASTMAPHFTIIGDHASWPLNGDITGVLIRRNTVTNTCLNQALEYGAIYIATSATKSVPAPAIYYNVIYANNTAGIAITNGGVRVAGATIYNNTITGNGLLGQGGGMDLSIDTSFFKINISVNNNVHGDSTFELILNKTSGGANASVVDYNIWLRAGQTVIIQYPAIGDLTFLQWQSNGFDTHGLSTDPLFVSSSDFHLGAGSPATGAGIFIPGISPVNPPNMGALDAASGGAATVFHSWSVKSIGIKTKGIIVNSQVNSDTGDTP